MPGRLAEESVEEYHLRHQTVWARRLVRWSVSLLPAEVQHAASAELHAAELRAAELQEPAQVSAPVGDPVALLRAAGTVLACDAVLASLREPDWAALVDAHREQPFGRAQRRALIARPDCPGGLTEALLAPWDSLVAGRLVARQGTVPTWVWRAAVARIGELRPSFLRHVLSGETAEELVLSVPRLDLLVRAVDGYDHNHHAAARAFWECVGRLLRQRLGADRAAWLVAASALPSHPGTFASLLRRVERATTPVREEEADLKLLAQAPEAVSAGIVADLSDAALTRMARRDLGGRRTREHLASMVLDRLVAAGVPPRALFAHWTYGPARTPATAVWLHGLDDRLDQLTEWAAHHDVTLRRLLAARCPLPGPVSDLLVALRACDGPIAAEAVLTAALGDGGVTPWHDLTHAHHAAPLPPFVLCALAARDGFPEPLARALPVDRLPLLAAQSPAAARTALATLPRDRNRWGLIHRIRSAGTLDDRELLALIRPAREVVQYAYGRSSSPAPSGDLLDRYGELLRAAGQSAPPGFWLELLRLLPAFDGTLPELLGAAAAPPPRT